MKYRVVYDNPQSSKWVYGYVNASSKDAALTKAKKIAKDKGYKIAVFYRASSPHR